MQQWWTMVMMVWTGHLITKKGKQIFPIFLHSFLLIINFRWFKKLRPCAQIPHPMTPGTISTFSLYFSVNTDLTLSLHHIFSYFLPSLSLSLSLNLFLSLQSYSNFLVLCRFHHHPAYLNSWASHWINTVWMANSVLEDWQGLNLN